MLGKLLMTAGRLYPFIRGRTRFFLTCVYRRSLEDALARVPNPVPMRRGYSLYTHEREFTSLWLRMWGDMEKDTRALILQSLPPGTAFLDAGANLGIFSVGIAHARPDVTVHAIEPNPRTAALLRQSVQLNRLEKLVSIYETALADHSGEISFFDNPENAGDSHIIRDGDAPVAASRMFKVPVCALDQYPVLLEKVEADGRRVACMKMDIQGAEVPALRGMKNFLSKHKPVIIVEATDDSLCRYGCDVNMLRAELESQGWVIEGRNGLNLVAKHPAA